MIIEICSIKKGCSGGLGMPDEYDIWFFVKTARLGASLFELQVYQGERFASMS